MNEPMIEFATWTRISRSLPWLSFIGIIVIISWMDIYIYKIMYIIFLGIRLLIDWFIFKKGSP